MELLAKPENNLQIVPADVDNEIAEHEAIIKGIYQREYEDSLRVEASTVKPFIEANTVECSLQEIEEKHIIPVFLKDNEPVISHADFIRLVQKKICDVYSGERILQPSIRLSHPIKGRIPEARNKPANDLCEHEKTLYYERMAFVIEVPSIMKIVDGCLLSLCIGGVKAYNLDHLYNRIGADQHFKLFIGFQNKVCTNLCISTEGYQNAVRVQSIDQLGAIVRTVLDNYNAGYQLDALEQLSNLSITERQFALLIGRCRMYQFLPREIQRDIPQMLFNDTQIGTIAKDYYRDESFCKQADGNINLWRLYNLFTGANKSSYIDNFLDRNVNAFSFVYALKMALDDKHENWFLN